MLTGTHTMSRWLPLFACIFLGLAMLVCGLLVPAHLRAVDVRIIEKAGRNTPALIDKALALVSDNNLGSARLLLQAAQQEGIAGRGKLGLAVTDLAKENQGPRIWGSPLSSILAQPEPDSSHPTRAGGAGQGSQPITELVIRLENREKALEFLKASPQRGVEELFRFRAATNTVLFPPSQSASGQPLDAALALCGLLFVQGQLSDVLSNRVDALAAQANRGGNSQPLEEVLMDFMSLGQRFDWDQLTVFVRRIEDVETLRVLTDLVRNAGGRLPVLFSAVQLSGNPRAVANYLTSFSQTGSSDLGSSLRYGAGGVNELLRRNQRLDLSGLRPPLGLDYCLRLPWLALSAKWLMYLSSGVLLAAALHFARPAVSALERPLQVRGFHVAREILFALGFLFVVLLLSEPFLAQESQKVEFPFRLRLPMAGSVVPAGSHSVHPSIMSQSNLLTLLLFFALQGLLYTASILKLAEIRRQKVLAPFKLKLLENEDHLFDAGLYLGFLGTIVSFIIFSLGVVKEFSLMVAYSSTSFGIIFVSLFKILHLRPARRRLLLEADAGSSEPVSATPSHTIAVHL